MEKSPSRQIWEVLDPRLRREVVVLFCLTVVGMILEMAGVGVVIPAMTMLTAQEAIGSHAWGKWLIEVTGTKNPRALVAWGLLLLVAVYLAKTAFLVFLAWRQAAFRASVHSNISRRLFQHYLQRPWTFHLERNSAGLIHSCALEVFGFAQVCSSVLGIVTEFLIVAGITLLLFVIEPFGAMAVAVALGSAALLFRWILKARLVRWGSLRQWHEDRQMQALQQGLGGAKDVKLLRCETTFLDEFSFHNRQVAAMIHRQIVAHQLPRLWYELLAVSGMSILGLLMLFQGKDTLALIPTLGVFAAAALRVLPSVNRIMIGSGDVRYHTAVVDRVHHELVDEADASPAVDPLSGQNAIPLLSRAIECRGVSFSYPRSAKAAVYDLSLSVPVGSAVGIIGESGSGKSTAVDLILGLLTPASGTIFVDGVDIHTNIPQWQDQIGYVPQSIFLIDDSIRRNVAFGVPEPEIDDEAVWRALKAAQLEKFIGALRDGINTFVGERGVRLSGGQRQRIGIARALYRDPPVLVLDEATSSLDTETEEEVMAAVNGLHGTKTLLIVAHRLTTVAKCDEVYRLEEGRVIRRGPLQELLR